MNTRVSGWISFAVIVLGIAGIMRIFDALWAFNYHGVLPENLEGAIFGHSLKTYGWIYLIVAAILIAGSILLMNGSAIGRWVGIGAGSIEAVTAVWWMPYFPVWALINIALGILVVYGLTLHWDDPEKAVA